MVHSFLLGWRRGGMFKAHNILRRGRELQHHFLAVNRQVEHAMAVLMRCVLSMRFSQRRTACQTQNYAKTPQNTHYVRLRPVK